MGYAMRKWLELAVCIAAVFAAALAGSLAMRLANGAWYDNLNKPSWTPPDWLFGPVWSVLYLLMGVSVWLVWGSKSAPGRGGAIAIFTVQLLLNAVWTGLFFLLQSPLAGLVDISLLWVAILAAITAFSRIRPLAATLLLPYLLWVGFAWTLNLVIWRMNR